MRWLDGPQLAGLPTGTSVVIDAGTKKPLVRGRVAHTGLGVLTLDSGIEVRLRPTTRGRVVTGTFESGDLVLRVGVPESDWRGGVVRCSGHEVYVESTTGFAWFNEGELETVEQRLSTIAHPVTDVA